MKYSISYTNPNSHFIDIILRIENISNDKTILQLPAWRPGRYELANFAQNIQKFEVTDTNGRALNFNKTTKDKWEVDTSEVSEITVSYNFYAYKMDAGSTWLDEEQLYINFVNCMVYDVARLNKACEVTLDLPDDYEVACGLPMSKKKVLQAESFYHLVESPMIASAKMRHLEYQVDKYRFHIWLMGDCEMDWEKVTRDFKAFSQNQIEMMGGFPCDDYHFLFQIAPYKLRHGVEHFNSTVIALGPGEEMNSKEMYESFMGISSHELFHTWNVIRIKPKEFVPYDFTKENYFKTGFVAEGFTTYYGDLFLGRSGVFGKKWFLNEMSLQLQRHLDNFGRHNLSLADASFDLWLDGYKLGIPDRKVSIYTKGALVALMLDLEIRMATKNKNSLDSLMRKLWDRFGDTKHGYTTDDILKMAEELSGISFEAFFANYINGTTPIEERFVALLKYVGCEVLVRKPKNTYESTFGFKVLTSENATKITKLHPTVQTLSVDDEIVAVNGTKVNSNLNLLFGDKKEVDLTIFRSHRLKKIKLVNSGMEYFHTYHIVKVADVNTEAQQNFEAWL